MLLAAATGILLFTLSVLSLEIIIPSTSQPWNTDGPQNLTWTSSNSDPANFTVVLSNPDSSVFGNSRTEQILAALVDTKLGHTLVNPPSGGWPHGSQFTVTLVKDSDNLGNVIAKSSTFEIKEPSLNGTQSVTRSQSVPTITSNSIPSPTDDGTSPEVNAASTSRVDGVIISLSIIFLVFGCV